MDREYAKNVLMLSDDEIDRMEEKEEFVTSYPQRKKVNKVPVRKERVIEEPEEVEQEEEEIIEIIEIIPLRKKYDWELPVSKPTKRQLMDKLEELKIEYNKYSTRLELAQLLPKPYDSYNWENEDTFEWSENT